MGKILEKLDVVDCEMESGKALFLHANRIHRSNENNSDRHRIMMHCTYNGVSNEPVYIEGNEHHLYRSIKKLPDSAIVGDCNHKSVFDEHQFIQPDKALKSMFKKYS